ncbi:polyprenol monophosphomannose synthase [bacterium]|nr:polyprenol monophosphomannose synthase [bacterium]
MASADTTGVEKILVVIPTYNEAQNIPRLLPEILRQSPALDVLVVDDNSPDGTARIVRSIQGTNPRIHILERPGKMGLGTAYVAGFKFALERDYEFVFEMDADFSHDPNEIPNFLAAAASADLVLGSRYTGGVRILNWPMQRLLLSYFANIYARIMTGLRIDDATGGFKCFRRRVLASIDLDGIRSNGYAFQIEMSFKAWKKGFRISEVPIVFLDRQQGTSKMSKRIVYEAFFMLWKLRWKSLFGKL